MWFKRRLVLVAVVLSFALSRVGLAEEESAPTYDLGEVLVTEEELPRGVQNVILQEEIKKIKTSRTADGLLENLAGIDIKRTSPGGDKGSAVTIRGFDESRCLILLDGRPLNGAGVYGGHYIDWSSLSTEDIERIEVIRGAKSAEYGNTLGGVVNIITKKGTKKPKTEVRISGGTFDTLEAMFSHSGSAGLLSYNLSAGHWQTNGYLRNNDVDRNNFAARLAFLLLEDLTLELGARHTIDKKGFIVENKKGSTYYESNYPESEGSAGGGPGISYRGGSLTWGNGSYWKNIRKQYDIKLKKPFGTLDLQACLYANDQDRTEYFYALTDRSRLILKRFAKPEDNTWGWLLKASQEVGKHKFRYGAEGAYLRYGGVDIKYADNAYFTRQPTNSTGARPTRRHSGFVQDTWNILSSLDLDMGLRYDYYYADEARATNPGKVTEHAVGPRLGISYRPWEGIEVEGNIARAHRFPTCPESYWYFSGSQPANRKSLSPEDALQIELGLLQHFKDKAKIGVRWYYYDVDDYIRTIFGYRPSRVVYNIDEVTFLGTELEAEYSFLEDISLFANYTYQTTEKKGDILDMSSTLTDKLTELPEHKANTGLRYRAKNGATADLTLRYIGKRSVLTGSLATAGAADLADMKRFATVAFQAAYPILKKDTFTGTLRLGIENMFDKSYEEIHGFPMPGRTIIGRLDIAF